MSFNKEELEKKYIIEGWYLLPRKKENEYEYQERMDDQSVHQFNEIRNWIQSCLDCDGINSWKDLLIEILNCGFTQQEQIRVLNYCTDWDSQTKHITKSFEEKIINQ